MKTRKEMLDYCNTVGKYIDKSFYNLNDIEECVQYILDADDNYMIGVYDLDYRKVIHEYNEDYYIYYHYDNIPCEILEKEDFWKLLFLKSDQLTNLYHISNDGFLWALKDELENFKDKDFKFAVKQWLALQNWTSPYKDWKEDDEFPALNKKELDIYNRYMNESYQRNE